VPGVAVLALGSLGFHAAGTPARSSHCHGGRRPRQQARVHRGRRARRPGHAPAHRGEALGIYYLGTSLAVAVAAPAGIALLRTGGIAWTFYLVTVLAAGILVFTLTLTPAATGRAAPSGGGLRLWSRHALGAAAVMVLITLGQSSIIGFVPLYAERHG
jgi:hypothetical protein